MTSVDDPERALATTPAATFWSSGSDGELSVGRCASCDRLQHPMLEHCHACPSAEVAPAMVSGRGVVLAYTINTQRWPTSTLEPPYVVAIVGLEEDEAVRLTTTIVGVPAEDVTVGLRVQVEFEPHPYGHRPVFRALDQSVVEPCLDVEPIRQVRPPRSSHRFEHTVALTGVGASERGRRLDRSANALAVDAALAALEDAGLEAGDIDGLGVYPGTSGMPGVSDGGVRQLEQSLGVRPTWHCGAAEVSGQTGMVIEAMLSVSAGLCRHALVVNAVTTEALPNLGGPGPAGELQWRLPYGAVSPANWIGMYANRYLHRYGSGREMLGWVAITERRNAADNPEALFSEPLDMDEYLSARPVTTPFGLLDCDVPCDGAVAVIVSARESARDLRRPPVLVDAVGTQITEDQTWEPAALTHQPNVFGPAAHLWSRSALRPEDVDVALLYDGFTFNVVTWLEALGFCGLGEAADFVDGGRQIAAGGPLPLNPHGGQLSEGRSNGYGGLREAIVQLRGDAGPRQVPGAEVAVVSSGGGIPSGCMMLTTDR